MFIHLKTKLTDETDQRENRNEGDLYNILLIRALTCSHLTQSHTENYRLINAIKVA